MSTPTSDCPPTDAELELAAYRTTIASLICLLVEGPRGPG